MLTRWRPHLVQSTAVLKYSLTFESNSAISDTSEKSPTPHHAWYMSSSGYVYTSEQQLLHKIFQPSIHSSICSHIQVAVQWQHIQQRSIGVVSLNYILELVLGDLDVFTGQPGYIISSIFWDWWSTSSWWEMPEDILMLKTPQLLPINMKEEQLYSEPPCCY